MNTLEEDRLEAAVASDYTVTYEGTDYTYTVPWHWGTGDFEDGYPVLTVVYEDEGRQRDDDTPMNDLIEYDPREGEPESDFHRGSRVTDVLTLTVADQAGFDSNGVPAHVVVDQIGKEVWRTFRFALDLNEKGANGESEMVFDVEDSPTGPFRQDDTVRKSFSAACHYTEIYTETVDSVADADTSVNTN